MRVFFMRAGHIVSVEELPRLSDEQATAKARAVFGAQAHVRRLRVVGSHAGVDQASRAVSSKQCRGLAASTLIAAPTP